MRVAKLFMPEGVYFPILISTSLSVTLEQAKKAYKGSRCIVLLLP
jgi:hypothetical protein